MTLEKGFIRSETRFGLSRKVNILIISCWLGYSACFYFFLFYLKEFARFTSFYATLDDYIMLSFWEQLLYNSFLAAISAFSGLAVVSEAFLKMNSFWRFQTRSRALNQTTSSQNYFVLFFLKLSAVYLMFGYSLNIFEYFNFFNYWYVFIILLFVLFHYQWNGLTPIFGGRAVRWKYIFGIVVLVFSVSISFLSNSVYGQIDAINKKRVPSYHIRYSLPEVKPQYTINRNDFLIATFYVGYQHKTDSLVVMTQDLYLLNWNGIRQYLTGSSLEILVNLKMDENVPVWFVKKLMRTIRESGQSRLLFSTDFEKGVRLRIPPPCESEPGNSPEIMGINCDSLYREMDLVKNFKIQIDNDLVSINGASVPLQKVNMWLVNKISKNPGSVFQIFVDETSKYKTYVQVVSYLLNAYAQERKALVKEQFGIEYIDETKLDQKIRDYLSSNMPINVWLWIEEGGRFKGPTLEADRNTTPD